MTASDAATGAAVAGRVFVDSADVAPTNTPFTHTFRARRVGRPPDVELIFPTVTVRAAGYPNTEVDTGF